jgi:YidC/Oxa1 family membrane protein insertase
MKQIFDTFFYEPLYNILVFLVGVIPGGNLGVAVIILTVLVKFVLFPLSQKSVKTQAKMREIEPELKKIKEKHKNNQQEQAKATMELYKKYGVNPFSGCLLMLIQLPVIFALYFVFLNGAKINADILYSFVSVPKDISMFFLGIDLAQKSLLFAFLAGITQYYQLALSIPPVQKYEPGKQLSFQEEFSRNMNSQMKYVFPALLFFISYTLSSAIALYFIVSNLFAVGQELYVRKKAKI